MNSIDKRAEFWNPANPGYVFHAEAKRLLELDLGSDRLTTVQSLCIIGLTYAQNALDQVGWPYWVRDFAMAEKMHIFGDLKADRTLTDDARLARGFIARAVFNLDSYVAALLSQPYQADAEADRQVSTSRTELSIRIHQGHHYLILGQSAKSGSHIFKLG